MLAVVLHGLVYFLLLPPWMGEDEPWHLEYARDLAAAAETGSDTRAAGLSPSQELIQARTRAEPEAVVRTQTEILDSMRRNRFWQRVNFAGWEYGASTLDHFVIGHTEAHQPPLYYRVCAFGIRLFGIDGVDQQLWFLRGLSFLCYLAVLALTYAFASLAAKDNWTPTIAVLIAAWLPMHARQAAMVNNDVLVKVFTGATLWLIGLGLVGRGGRTLAGAIAICAVLAFTTKATAIGTTALAGLAIAAFLTRGRSLPTVLISAVVAVLALAGGALLYWRAVGSHMALPTLAQVRRGLSAALTESYWRETQRTFVGSFNWYSRTLPGAVYTVVVAFLGAGLLGSLVAAVRRPAEVQRLVLALAWAALVLQLLTMMLRGFAAGRYLFPILPALATLLAVGWIAPLTPRWRAHGAVFLTAALVLYDGIALWSGLVPAQYLAWSS